MNQLNHLKQFSTIVADTGDIDVIRYYKLKHATTNPSLILNSPLSTTYSKLFEDALIYSRKKGGNQNNKITNASDRLIINIGSKILENIPGYISTEIDARLSFNSNLIIEKAHKLINMYHEKNIDTSRVLIKIASTWEGIKAAEILEQSNIKCNLTLLFSLTQAQACAERKIYLISPFIGRIYDWYYQHNLLQEYCIDNDPGVNTCKNIYYHYKKYSYNTIIMGASFRTIDQILALAGCDYLTISPHLLEKLSNNTQNTVERHLIPPHQNQKIFNKPVRFSKENFFLEHNQNKMSVDKLHEGIQKFSIDQQHLQDLLIKQL